MIQEDYGSQIIRRIGGDVLFRSEVLYIGTSLGSAHDD
jgi:hypothetical protein